MTDTDTKDTRTPTKSYRAGSVEGAIWPQEKEQDGRTYIQYSVRIQKRYKDKDGNWQATDYFFPGDLPNLALVTNKAFEFIMLKESENEGGNSSS